MSTSTQNIAPSVSAPPPLAVRPQIQPAPPPLAAAQHTSPPPILPAQPSPLPAAPPQNQPVGEIRLSKEWVLPPLPKPGRKPATDTPPTKRKAQNRAAQRAFRERRAQKVNELEEELATVRAANDELEKQRLATIDILSQRNLHLERENADLRQRLNELNQIKSLEDELMAGSPTDSGLGTSVTSGSVAPETPSPPPASASASSSACGGGGGGARTGGCGGPGGFCPCREAKTGESVPLNPKKRPGSPTFNGQRKPAPPLETDFTNLFNRSGNSSSNNNNNSTTSSSTLDSIALNLGADSSMGMGMPCGLCQDGSTCICAEFAEAERKKKEEDRLRGQPPLCLSYDDDFGRTNNTSLENFANSLRLANSMSSSSSAPSTSISNSGLTATAASSTINQLLNDDPLWKDVATDSTWTPYIKDEDLDMDIESSGWKGLPSMRWDTNLDLGLPTPTPAPAPAKNKGGCTGEGPGNCDLCRKDARASLFCLSVTKVVSEKRKGNSGSVLLPARRAGPEKKEDNPEEREIDFTTLGKSKAKVTISINNSGPGSSASSPPSTPASEKQQAQQPEKIYLSCKDAYISLSKHQGFKKAMMESIILPLETRQEGGEKGRFTVEANSVRSVLEKLDREFGRSVGSVGQGSTSS